MDDEGVRAGIDVRVPSDLHVELSPGLGQLVFEKLEPLCDLSKHRGGARVCIAGGSVSARADRIRFGTVPVKDRPDELGAVLLSVEIPPGVLPDGEPAPVRYETSGGLVLPLQYKGMARFFAPRFFVVFPGGRVTVTREGETATEFHMGLPRKYVLDRVKPGSTYYPLIPHTLQAEGWAQQILA